MTRVLWAGYNSATRVQLNGAPHQQPFRFLMYQTTMTPSRVFGPAQTAAFRYGIVADELSASRCQAGRRAASPLCFWQGADGNSPALQGFIAAIGRHTLTITTRTLHQRKAKPVPISNTPAVERIARVLAGARLSANAEGSDRSAGPEVDAEWRDHINEALAVLRTLREPDQRMAQAGDPQVWEAMVLAALEDGSVSG